MKPTTVFSIILLALLLSLGSVKGNPPEGEGWQALFNGKTLKGFMVFGGFAPYHVEDGAIVGRTAEDSPNTFLITTEHYADFELVFEVKVDNRLNSGVQIRSHFREWGIPYIGPQVEIESSPGQAGWIYGEGLNTGWLSEEPRSSEKSVNEHSVFKNDQWNHYRIFAKGPLIETFINGTRVASYSDKGLYRNFSTGSIGFQVHSVRPEMGSLEVRWRNIYLRRL